MPRISTTTRIGTAAIAASLVTALAGPGGAGAVDVQIGPPKIVDAVKKDAGRLSGTLQETLDQVAPNTRQAVQETADETVAVARREVTEVKQAATTTARQTTQKAERAVDDTSDLAGRSVEAGKRIADRKVTQARASVSEINSSARRTVQRTRAQADERIAEATALAQSTRNELIAEARELGQALQAALSGGRISMWHPILGSWVISWTRSEDGCLRLENNAPLSALRRLHVAANVNDTQVGVDQRGSTTSAQAGC